MSQRPLSYQLALKSYCVACTCMQAPAGHALELAPWNISSGHPLIMNTHSGARWYLDMQQGQHIGVLARPRRALAHCSGNDGPAMAAAGTGTAAAEVRGWPPGPLAAAGARRGRACIHCTSIEPPPARRVTPHAHWHRARAPAARPAAPVGASHVHVSPRARRAAALCGGAAAARMPCCGRARVSVYVHPGRGAVHGAMQGRRGYHLAITEGLKFSNWLCSHIYIYTRAHVRSRSLNKNTAGGAVKPRGSQTAAVTGLTAKLIKVCTEP